MNRLFELKAAHHNFINATGFAALSGYDPAMHRFFEALKQSILDEVPALIRLHSISDYPFSEVKQNILDLEGHAVCVVGYNEEDQTFAIMDPMKTTSIHWIREDFLKANVVDCTQGIVIFVAPLWIEARRSEKLEIKVGFYVPKMNVMDRDNMFITDVKLNIKDTNNNLITTLFSEKTIDAITPHEFNVHIPLEQNSIIIEATAKISGTRPYKFENYISSTRIFDFSSVDAKKHLKKQLTLLKQVS